MFCYNRQLFNIEYMEDNNNDVIIMKDDDDFGECVRIAVEQPVHPPPQQFQADTALIAQQVRLGYSSTHHRELQRRRSKNLQRQE
jgi:hypothetical protein